MSYGEGDPSLSPQVSEAHRAAMQAGQDFYLDPSTGFQVMTAAFLRGPGACCGKGCRHCPFSASEQTSAGRVVRRPAED